MSRIREGQHAGQVVRYVDSSLIEHTGYIVGEDRGWFYVRSFDSKIDAPWHWKFRKKMLAILRVDDGEDQDADPCGPEPI